MDKDDWFIASQHSQLSPFPNYLSGEGITHEMKKLFGFGYRKVLFIFRDNDFWGCFLENDYERVAAGLFKELKKNPSLFEVLSSRERELGRCFLGLIKKWAKLDLEKNSNEKLAEFSRQYAKKYREIYANYFIILSVEQILTKYLRDFLFKKFKDKKIASDYFNKLTTEPAAMVNKQEEIAALKLAIKIKQNKKWIKILESKKSRELIRKDGKLFRLIKNHEKNWFWLTRDYEGEILTFFDFVERIKSHLRLDPAKKLEKINHELAVLARETKRIKINDKYWKFFKAMRDGIYLKELRKSIVSQSLYYFDPVLSEIARRGKISLKQARFLLTREIVEMLLKNKNFSSVLNERIKLSLYLASGGTTKVISGRPAERIFKKIYKVPKNIKEFKGLPVSSGKARGRVKIVKDSSEINKVKPGDIIITGQATPAFSRAVAIAAGLIAEGGTGITSHPATLAREAKIPCVTNTKIATKVLKDGDRVEIDGDRGIVKILKT
ncbi:MAG: PEP-utilizing enzyme [Patescibacteria group bacterium]|nr:PEP-utilizing enzyme [Patescibacteria group bacterium]MDD5294926.1 PEP-utilizing enzyme [Patescibacteria group bacterium]MDD5554313.1 PEP-utilizing enzyme [Patescibacteria group bacterium]